LQVANNTLLGRLSGGGSEIDALTASDVRTLINVADGAQVNVPTNLTYTAATRVIASDTGTDATLPIVTTGDAGLAPASGGGPTNFLRADGTWAEPAGGGSTQVYVQDTDPGMTSSGIWIQTGLAPGGTGFTFWFEDGL
jgi:hypothetical protein